MAEKTTDELIVPANEPMPIVEGTPNRQRGEARWLHLLLYIITSLIFAFFLVLGGRWVYHKTHHNNQAPAPAQTANQTPQPPASNSQSSGTAKNNKSAKPPAATTKPQASSAKPAPVANPLPNSGPGNVAAIFVSVSLAVAGLHYVLSSKNYRQKI